ncbi:LysR family transcriptional regulator [Halobacteriovorax sp. GB3]|uniref:LysR family transcriptional regulator n=1 Tax=Halobacteriovorax sp. GB3 TaxID=2719615 RepID=UPI0023621F91|nr:LysR family transcriptional regulator [Halobacteriovorax sp. GB3]MDD0852489.1 LysR family transcriptional regulator [Halobacteriovorax sp. GB3]
MKTIKWLTSIMAFTKIAELESYSKAAKELDVSKAHLSKMIKELEDSIGQRLINRTTRALKLTYEGERFFHQCKGSIDNLKFAQDEMLKANQIPRGQLRLSVAGAFAEEYVTPVVAKLCRLYPELNVEMVYSQRMVKLVEENFDVAIRVGKLEDSSLVAKQIASRKEYICVSPVYLEQQGQPKTPEELKKHNCLLSTNNIWTFWNKRKLTPIKIRGNFKSNNARAILKAGLEGLGIVRLPEVYVREYLDRGELVSILEKFLPEDTPIWAVMPSKQNLSINTRVFLTELEIYLKNL